MHLLWFHVQALIGNSQWSSRTSAGPKLYHVGTIPNAKVGSPHPSIPVHLIPPSKRADNCPLMNTPNSCVHAPGRRSSMTSSSPVQGIEKAHS